MTVDQAQADPAFTAASHLIVMDSSHEAAAGRIRTRTTVSNAADMESVARLAGPRHLLAQVRAPLPAACKRMFVFSRRGASVFTIVGSNDSSTLAKLVDSGAVSAESVITREMIAAHKRRRQTDPDESPELREHLRRIDERVAIFRATGRAEWECAMHRLWLTIQLPHLFRWHEADAKALRAQVEAAYRDARAGVRDQDPSDPHKVVAYYLAVDTATVPEEYRGPLATAVRDQLAELKLRAGSFGCS